MSSLRSAVFVLLLAGVSLVIGAGRAQAAELEDYLQMADDAGFSGRQIVVTVWDGVARAGVYEVEQAAGMRIIAREGDDSLVRSGRIASPGRPGVAVPAWTQPAIADKYSMRSPVSVTRLGRSAQSIDVYEGDVLRARLVFDDETYAPLSTEVYTSDGSVFRYTALIDLGPTMQRLPAAIDKETGQYDVLVPTDAVDLPASAGGYTLADAYLGQDDSTQAFYTDGLFSFSVFVLEGSFDPGGDSDLEAFDVGDRRFERMLTPSEVWVFWERLGTHYVLVGDLPPDHLESVLGELPRPAKRNVFQRFWKGLFG